MSLYFSGRALDESTGIAADKISLWKFTDSQTVKLGSKVTVNPRPIDLEGSSESTSTRSIERPVVDSDIIAIMREKIKFKDIFSEDLKIGEFVKVDTDNYRHGCVPVLSLDNQQQNELTIYLGEGLAAAQELSWWRRLWVGLGFGGPTTPRPVALQVFGSADNYSRWNAVNRSSLIAPGEWYPSSPEGMALILGPEAGTSDNHVRAEVAMDNREESSPAFLCDGFDHMVETLFHNSHREAGVERKLSHAPQVDRKVEMWGRVYGIREGRASSDGIKQEPTVLVRPIMIRARS